MFCSECQGDRGVAEDRNTAKSVPVTQYLCFNMVSWCDSDQAGYLEPVCIYTALFVDSELSTNDMETFSTPMLALLFIFPMEYSLVMSIEEHPSPPSDQDVRLLGGM